MKPYLRLKNLKGLRWKIDYHPKKGFINWWEDAWNFVSRSTVKQQLKKQQDDD